MSIPTAIWSAQRPVRDLRPGDHAWLAYRCEEEFQHVAGAYVREGLLARERVVYFSPDADPSIPGVVGPPSPGLLTVVRAHGTLTEAVAALTAEVTAAVEAGYTTVRVCADLTWAVGDPALPECERLLDTLIAPSTSVTAVCAVDRYRCPEALLTELAAAHAVRACADPDFEDSVLHIVRTFRPRGLALRGELDASRHAVLDQALALVLAGGEGPDDEVHLDLAGLRFIDLGALNMLADAATRRTGCAALILDRMPPQLHEVITTVGWNMLPGLELGSPPYDGGLSSQDGVDVRDGATASGGVPAAS